jgi:hypoxanthine-DNA glycosylase
LSPLSRAGLPGVIPADARLLVLGSLPGDRSLAEGRYYAHPRNQFWRLIGAVLGEDIAGLDYADRLARLAARRVGLWDVYAEAVRQGSLDAAIRDGRPNDLAGLCAHLPGLRLVAFNGLKAGSGARLLPPGVRHVVLPSSSPAHTLGYDAKRRAWQDALGHVLDD